MRPAAGLDPEALLVAMVIAPGIYSRNRFFDLHHDADVRGVRRRAAQLRSIVGHFVGAASGIEGDVPRLLPAAGGRIELSYAVPALGVRRRAVLEPIELALIRVIVARGARAQAGELTPSPSDSARIKAVLARLVPSPNSKGNHATHDLSASSMRPNPV